MADGDFISIDQHRWAVKLLDGVTTTTTGPWVEIPAWYNIRSFWSSAFTGTDTVDIQISNSEANPTSAVAGPIARTLTASTLAASATEAYRWVRAIRNGNAVTTAVTLIVECARNE